MFRNKLASALANWHPADRSARSILAPWAEVFTKGSMNAFLLNNIIPKLEAALVHLPINPLNQVNTNTLVEILKGLFKRNFKCPCIQRWQYKDRFLKP